ncbi:unnamed protein product, partial [Laminaria digitata]
YSNTAWGLPSKEFNLARPSCITVQGQDRLAVFISVCGDKLDLATARAGALAGIELFPDSASNARELEAMFLGTKAKISTVVHGYL